MNSGLESDYRTLALFPTEVPRVTTSRSAIKEPSSIDELLTFIAKCTREHFSRTQKPLAGALLSHLIRQEFPGLDYTKLGLTKLGDAIRIAVDRRLLQRNAIVSHLEVLPIEPAANAVAAQPPETAGANRVFVRPEIWRELVFSGVRRPAYFDRSTQQIRHLGNTGASTPDASLVQIDRVPVETQISWLRDFLKSRASLTNDTQEYLHGLLHGQIDQLAPTIARDWRVLRTGKIVEHVRAWAQRNGIDVASVLVPKSATKKSNVSRMERTQEISDVRRAVCAAIQEMTLEELEEISIPLRYVLRHFTAK
jgi:hypothetical protein